jgi:hypothetical protein
MAEPIHHNKLQTHYHTVLSALNTVFTNIRKNIALFLICTILPVAALVFITKSKPTTYRASFTVAYEELVRKIYGDRIGKINALIAQKKHDKLSMLLGITPAAAKTIEKLEGRNILGQELEKDLNTDRIPFVVVLYVTDTSVINELQTGLVNFLDSGSPYLASKKAIKNQELDKELAYIDRQISYIDSLSKRMGSAMINTPTQGTQAGSKSLFEFSYELYRKKQELERRKVMPENLQVIDDILVPTKISQPVAKMAIVGLFIGLFIYATLMIFIIPALKFKRP